jgi:hypothetical protein
VHGLRELQLQFGKALLLGFNEEMAGHLVDNGLTGERRFAVYRNNVRESFTAALSTTYPVLRRLVGEDFFRQLASTYQRAHPSSSGNLFYIGRQLPLYLETQFGAGQYEYFAHVARLEWLCQEVMWAADATGADLVKLAAIPAERYSHLRLTLHPSVRLMESHFPVVRIWQANQPDAQSDFTIDLDEGGDRVLLRRSDEGIEMHRLKVGDFELLRALSEGEQLGPALELALQKEPALAFSERLAFWTRHGVITDFSTDL